MPIIFSDANAYQEDLGPSEGEMFFTNLLSGLQKGVEEGGRRKYAQELRQQELADQIAAEKRQDEKQLAQEGRLQSYLRESEIRQERRNLEDTARRQLERDQERTQQLEDETRKRTQAQEDWVARGGPTRAEADKLELTELQRRAEKAATEASQQTMAESAMGDLAGLLQMPEGVPYAPGYPDIDARVQSALDKIADRAKSITDSVARNRFMEQANTRLRNELQMLTEQQRVKQQVEEQRRVEESRLIDAATAEEHINSGARFIPQNDPDFVVRGLSTRESALNSLYKNKGLKPDQWSKLIGDLLDQYVRYASARQAAQAKAYKDSITGKGGNLSGLSDDMAFKSAMGNAPVWNFPSGTQVPAGDIIEKANAFLGVQK